MEVLECLFEFWHVCTLIHKGEKKSVVYFQPNAVYEISKENFDNNKVTTTICLRHFKKNIDSCDFQLT